MLASALNSVATLLILMAVGFCVAKKPWFQGAGDLLTALMLRVIFPVNVVVNVLDNFTGITDWASFALMFGTVWGMLLLSMAIGWAFSMALGVRRERKGIFICATAFPNILLLGFPFVETIYGSGAMPFAVVYFIANTLMFWTAAPLILMHYNQEGEEKFRLSLLKKCINPSLIAIFIGIAILLLGISLPVPIYGAMKRISQSSVALAMIFIGSVIRGSGLKIKALFNRDMIAVLLLKTVLVMGTLLAVFRFLPIAAEAKKVFLLITAMPVCVNLSILVHRYQSDSAFCALVSTAMNLICVLLVPVFVVIMEALLG